VRTCAGGARVSEGRLDGYLNIFRECFGRKPRLNRPASTDHVYYFGIEDVPMTCMRQSRSYNSLAFDDKDDESRSSRQWSEITTKADIHLIPHADVLPDSPTPTRQLRSDDLTDPVCDFKSFCEEHVPVAYNNSAFVDDGESISSAHCCEVTTEADVHLMPQNNATMPTRQSPSDDVRE